MHVLQNLSMSYETIILLDCFCDTQNNQGQFLQHYCNWQCATYTYSIVTVVKHCTTQLGAVDI